MFIATVIVSLIFAAALTASAVGKFTQQESPMAVMDTVGFPRDKVWLLGVAEVAGAVGLIIGLWWWPLGSRGCHRHPALLRRRDHRHVRPATSRSPRPSRWPFSRS